MLKGQLFVSNSIIFIYNRYLRNIVNDSTLTYCLQRTLIQCKAMDSVLKGTELTLHINVVNILPNQELSKAKSELQGEIVGVCSSYKRGGQPPYNSALRSLQMCLLVHV